jgi:hypothetical protein
MHRNPPPCLCWATPRLQVHVWRAGCLQRVGEFFFSDVHERAVVRRMFEDNEGEGAHPLTTEALDAEDVFDPPIRRARFDAEKYDPASITYEDFERFKKVGGGGALGRFSRLGVSRLTRPALVRGVTRSLIQVRASIESMGPAQVELCGRIKGIEKCQQQLEALSKVRKSKEDWSDINCLYQGGSFKVSISDMVDFATKTESIVSDLFGPLQTELPPSPILDVVNTVLKKYRE